MFWTDPRVKSLKKLWSDGLSAGEIAEEIGGITRIDVILEAHRRGLSGGAKKLSSTALVPIDVEEDEINLDSLPHALRLRPSVRDGNPLAIFLTIYTLERLVRELLPFYGVDCPVAVVLDNGGSTGRVLRGTLATIEGWTATAVPGRSMLVLVG